MKAHSEADAIPTEIGGYSVVDELIAGETYLTLAPGRRQVVCKRLDPDCLIQDGAKLHPTVRDRLERIREIPLARVANLYGVERDPSWNAGAPYLVWEYVAGDTLDEWVSRPGVSSADLLLAMRELLLTVESLHARGIVHGAIHGRNVIVDASGQLRLTHVSPLLYTDPQNDLTALSILLAELAERRRDCAGKLTQLAAAAERADGTLRGLASHLAFGADEDEVDDHEAARAADLLHRRRMRMTALAVVIAAVALSYGLKHAAVARWGTSPQGVRP